MDELYQQATYSVQTLQTSLTRTKGFISVLERSRVALQLSELHIKSPVDPTLRLP